MKKEELKQIIKPLIKECLKEVLIEEGFAKVLSETKEKIEVKTFNKPIQEHNSKPNLNENRKKMLDAIAMGGFDPFQGTKPLTENQAANTTTVNPGVQAGDRGVDISNLLQNKNLWKQTLNAMNGKKDKE